MTANRFGLDRNIPAAVKREVRQRCGFGCISCGASIYEYDHFDPPFVEAREHVASGIVLLCPTCHSLKSKGILTVEQVAELNAAPAAKKNGNSAIRLPHFKGLPALRLGGGVLINDTPMPIRVNSTPILEFHLPEPGSRVTRISAHITGADGESLLRIVENEWIVDGGVWDFEWVGQRMTIRDESGATALQLFIAPPNYLEIERLVTLVDNWTIRISDTELRVGNAIIADCVVSQWKVGIQASSVAHPSRLQMGFGIHIVEADEITETVH